MCVCVCVRVTTASDRVAARGPCVSHPGRIVPRVIISLSLTSVSLFNLSIYTWNVAISDWYTTIFENIYKKKRFVEFLVTSVENCLLVIFCWFEATSGIQVLSHIRTSENRKCDECGENMSRRQALGPPQRASAPAARTVSHHCRYCQSCSTHFAIKPWNMW